MSVRQKIIALVLALVVFSAGVVTGRLQAGNPRAIPTLDGLVSALQQRSPQVDYSLLTTVWDRLQSRYVDRPLDPQQMLYGALAGLIQATGDPYSDFFTPEQAKAFEDEISGDFEGIGAEIGIKRDQLVVIAPLPNSPAAKANITPGDAILAIDGTTTSGLSLDDAVSRLRGKAGTTVQMTIQKAGADPQEVTLTREKIRVQSVALSWQDGAGGKGPIAVVTISSFTQDSAKLFHEVTQQLLLKDPSAIVVDVRNDSGGYLDQAIEIAEAFIPDGTIVTEEFGDGTRKTYSAEGSAPLRDLPVVVLINEGSASASEILAGALHERRDAKLVGQQSFGKGSVQELEDLPDGSTLKLTVARWLTPSGASIQPDGLTPDEVVTLTKEDYDADRDPQRDRALELLRAMN